MADQTAVFAVELKDGVSSPAKAAAVRAKELRDQLKQDSAALGEMSRMMRTLKGATVPNTAAIGELKTRMAALKASSASTAGELVSLGENIGALPAPANAATAGVGDLVGAVTGAGGPLGSMASKLQNVVQMFGKAGLAGAALVVVAAVAAAVVAIGAAVVALGRLGLAASDARRSEMLHLEGLTKTINYYGIAAGKASDLQAAIDRVSSTSAMGRGEIAGYSEQLYKMGLRGGNLSKALEATAIVASTQGDAAAQSFMGMAAGAGAVGQSVDKLADRVKSRLGGIAERQAMSLGVQMSKLRENVTRIFDGVKIEGFLRELNIVTGLFSQNAAVGKALKTIFEALFNPIFGGAEGAGMAVKRFIQGAVIGVLQLTIMFLTARNRIRDAFAGLTFRQFDWLNIALNVGGAAAIGLAIALGVVVAAAAALAYPFIALAAAITAAMSIDLASAGSSMIDGLVMGIFKGSSKLIDSVKSLAASAKNAFTSALGIQSPSKVFRTYGVFTAEGAAEGIEAGSPDVQAAAANMVSVPAAQEPKGGGGVGRGGTITIQNLNVTAGGGDARSLAQSIKLELERILEGTAINMGAA